MDNHNSSYHFGGVTGNNLMPVPTFSAYNLFRNCNYILSPQAPEIHSKAASTQLIANDCSSLISGEGVLALDNEVLNLSSKSILGGTQLFGYQHQLRHTLNNDQLNTRSFNSPCSSIYAAHLRRQRGEKKPIPEEQKDEKYFERRRRNNQAAKKSRDARKMREDQIALRATILEHENAILRAQVLTLREEASSLRQLLLQKKTLELSTERDSQTCRS